MNEATMNVGVYPDIQQVRYGSPAQKHAIQYSASSFQKKGSSC